MYVEQMLTLAVEAWQNTFTEEHPNPEVRGIPVRVEWPLTEADYPCVWVNFVTTGDIRAVGLGHVEHSEGEDGVREVFRWAFEGVLETTVAALGNLERARLIDEVTKTIAFGTAHDNRGTFVQTLEHNDLIGVTPVYGAVSVGGFAETPGTPWQTDDVIYEATISMTIRGEVAFSPSDRVLVPLSDIRFLPYHEGVEPEPDPQEPPGGSVVPGQWI